MIKGYYERHEVEIDGEILDLSHARTLRDHAPDVLWGYHGSGPSMLSLSLLLHFGATDEEALAFYQEFKREIIATIPAEDFQMENSKVMEWLEARRVFFREFPVEE